MDIKIGKQLKVRAYKSDGRCYRHWEATVEAHDEERLELVMPSGGWIEDENGGWASENALRNIYWYGKWYCLLEVFNPQGELVEIYVNINSPIVIEDSTVSFTDYELDVSRIPPDPARLVDQDEFEQAAREYGYTQEFTQACYRAAEEALKLANDWAAAGMPKGI